MLHGTNRHQQCACSEVLHQRAAQEGCLDRLHQMAAHKGCSGRLLPALLVVIPEDEILRLASHARQRCGVWGMGGSPGVHVRCRRAMLTCNAPARLLAWSAQGRLGHRAQTFSPSKPYAPVSPRRPGSAASGHRGEAGRARCAVLCCAVLAPEGPQLSHMPPVCRHGNTSSAAARPSQWSPETPSTHAPPNSPPTHPPNHPPQPATHRRQCSVRAL